jgi:ABC-type lipoprotein release transport system permease subunit
MVGEKRWWRIGWRNLGRNRRRSIVTASALAIGYFSVVLMVGLLQGLVAEMVDNGTGIVTGQLQVHADDYLPDKEVYATIGGRDGADVTALVATIRADPAVAAATPRVYGGGLVSTGTATAAALFLGVDPDLEPQVSRLMESLERGRHPEAGAWEVLIGSEMARTLGTAPGDEIVVVAPAIDGSLGNDLFIVAGVFHSGLVDLDRAFALFPLDVLQALMAMPPSRVHEIAARVPDPWVAAEVATRLGAELERGSLPVSAESWMTLRPEMVEYANLSEAMEWILMVIVFAMAIFGVANTMLMATFERRYEFALLRALGTTPGAVIRSVLYEAVALGAIALAAGVVITVPVLMWWYYAPPSVSWLFGETTLSGALMRPVLRVEYPWLMGVVAAAALFGTAVAAALYPAIRAARVSPADTLSGR